MTTIYDSPTNEAVDAFLVDLQKITDKHGLFVWGCGCCGSPSLMMTTGGTGRYKNNRDDHMGADVEWTDPEDSD